MTHAATARSPWLDQRTLSPEGLAAASPQPRPVARPGSGAAVRLREPYVPREAYIEAAWQRCRDIYHLDPDHPPPGEHIGGAALKLLREERGLFERVGRVEMHRLLGQINHQVTQSAAPSRYVLMLADASGAILDAFTDSANTDCARTANMAPGFLWNERHAGVNGPGTCLHDRRARVVHREDHYFTRNSRMTCSAAPIWGANGTLLGVLDASSLDCDDSRAAQVPTIALVSMSARIIEQMHFTHSYRDCLILRFHERPELVGLPYDSLLAIDEHGTIRAVDSTVPGQLGKADHTALLGRSVAELFDLTTDRLFEHAEAEPFAIWPIAHGADRHGFASIWPAKQVRPRARAGLPGSTAQSGSGKSSAAPRAIARPQRPATPPLARFAGTDPVMADNVWRAERVMNRDINILLLGETGTGKDSFARAIHRASERHAQPFIAMSCAAIPEQLIESELFGYEAGAFTGARTGGMRGKALAAHGGTLFLDEIGDMPLSIQARLLRLLEEKEIVPLGSSTPIPVDIRVISATHRDLEALVASNDFRMDLFYRLNGVTLTMPPLRARADRAALIEQICREEASSDMTIAPDATRDLLAHDWPGNIRELRNTLRTAIAFAEGGIIERSHLPRLHNTAAPKPSLPATIPVTPPDERAHIVETLEQHHWRIAASAAALGISRNTLYRKMHRYGLMADGT
ncbi:sigma-54-dependent Fis family transcriptional regulator [Acidiphilium sp. PA]|uniref:sigma-54-dependent Fis family transcriptional regulator n=1 Tax=Acidiphilium sp. PA TaxID=2871705 RepID=UPI002244E56F|nr:sigma-54-dependent Fis family transcriptional regulator [Acidiphilium sp. PA]MCW8306022.1 sigma-54-dependent Fis family transcriptional regulator [Acidiphilium sp. PA]